ncbi:MAG TPA: LuxR C-terminal-related transcriptional regulator [Candidatus Sulfomarinibacteraceae bacterium]|nr:LuxR C-terminal-related transcriptional regulator [Candidatus Sulfomarinibacteraceae bacterium]
MDPVLLPTKVRIPPQPRRVLPRRRLIDALEQGAAHYKLTLLAAPAGYGKTTLLAQWAHASDSPLAWVSLGADDDDFERFFRYLLAAWEVVQPEVRDSSLGLLLETTSPDSDALLPAFVRTTGEMPGQLRVVLDDYHLIQAPAIHQALAFLLDHLPPTFHFVLSGRAEPPLPLARYRARRQLLELRAEELRLRPAEAGVFLSETMGLALTGEDEARLQEPLEGWIAGLQLAALSVRRGLTDAEQPLIVGRQRFIADYLAEDVLAHLPQEEQDFLLQTSILQRLCGSLCEAVTGEQGGQEMLERLERKNLFLMPLDDRREWFRYHGLFADFLQGELQRRSPAAAADCHRRAAAWYLAHELPEQAFHHALAGDDPQGMAQIFDRYLTAKLNAGELTGVRRWLEALPADWLEAYPVLDLGRAGFLAYTGAVEACMHCVDDVERRLRPAESEERRWQLARVTAVRCFLACMANDVPRAERLAEQALAELPEENLGFRPGIYAALGDTYRNNGRWQEAQQCYQTALTFTESPPIRVQAVHLYGALADLELQQGNLQNAYDYWREALAAIQERKAVSALPLSGWVHIRLGELLYQWNDLDQAREHLSRGLERAEAGGDVRALIAGYLLAARLELAQGDVESAAAHIEQARPLVEKAAFAEWRGHFHRCRLELWLAQDRLRAAVAWADEMLQGGEQQGWAESEAAQLSVARALIMIGDAASIARAQALLQPVLQAAEAQGRTGILIEALALQALAHWRRGRHTGALTSLQSALRPAQPEGYVRVFADLGLPLARLLQEARSRDVMPEYVARLLQAFEAGVVGTLPIDQGLPEPLTEREQEVLDLLAAGLTNREIGEALVISPQTVKKHAGNIYGKLGVGNRTEAVGRARELNLLE